MTRLIAALIVIGGQALIAQQLPDGPGAAVVKSRCMICHESDIITSQHLSLTGWTNSINKMVRWGSQITPEEREVLQPYLVAHFGPRLAASHGADAGLPTVALAEVGPAVYQRACQVCHDAGIIEQQHLGKTGWTNSVNKMIRWGAAVPDADKDALISYLAARFGPR